MSSVLKRTTESFIQELNTKFPDYTIEILSEYKGVAEKVHCRCKICGHEWSTDARDLLKGTKCIKCFRKSLIKNAEIFYAQMKEINPNIIFLSPYIKEKQKIKCKCLIDGYEWEATPNKLLQGRGCPKCAHKVVDKEEFKRKVYEANPDVILLTEYQKRDIKIKCQCATNPEHFWEASPGNLLRGTGCPHCTESKGEKRIRKFLENNKIVFNQEFWFDDCRDTYPLPFDFYLPEYNMCIEYDGIQHFQKTSFNGIDDEKATEGFVILQKHDKIKNEYCINNNIKLCRIAYTNYKNIEKILSELLLIEQGGGADA